MLMTIFLSILNRFKNFFHFGKFAVKWISEIPPHLAYVATLPSETLMSAKQAINDKLQDSVATYLRCGGCVNNQIKNALVRLANTQLKDGESARSNHVVACNFVKYSTILIFFTDILSNKPFLIWSGGAHKHPWRVRAEPGRQTYFGAF